MQSANYQKLDNFVAHDYGSIADSADILLGKESGADNLSSEAKPNAANFTSTEIIRMTGFGKAQKTAVFVIFLSFFSAFALLSMMPLLSTRLYVDLNLTPQLESALGSATFAAIGFRAVLTLHPPP